MELALAGNDLTFQDKEEEEIGLRIEGLGVGHTLGDAEVGGEGLLPDLMGRMVWRGDARAHAGDVKTGNVVHAGVVCILGEGVVEERVFANDEEDIPDAVVFLDDLEEQLIEEDFAAIIGEEGEGRAVGEAFGEEVGVVDGEGELLAIGERALQIDAVAGAVIDGVPCDGEAGSQFEGFAGDFDVIEEAISADAFGGAAIGFFFGGGVGIGMAAELANGLLDTVSGADGRLGAIDILELRQDLIENGGCFLLGETRHPDGFQRLAEEAGITIEAYFHGCLKEKARLAAASAMESGNVCQKAAMAWVPVQWQGARH